MTRCLQPAVLAVLILLILAPTGFAHHGPPHEEIDEFDDARFAAGLVHPFSGWDHLLTAMSVGVIAWRLRSVRGMVAAMTFLGGIACGVFTGVFAIGYPLATLVLFAGTCACAGAVLSGWRIPSPVVPVAFSVLGAVHGGAHRLAAAEGISSGTYAAGICLATAAILAAAAACAAAGCRLAGGQCAVEAGT